MSQLPASRQSRGLQERAASLEDLVQAFLRDQDIKASSKATYERSLRQFVAWLEETGRADHLADLQREDLLEYKSSLVDRDLSAYSISLYLTAVRRLFQWLEAKKVYPNVAKGVKGARKPRGHRKDVLSPEELRLALEGIDRSTLTGLRDYAILNLLARTGLRTVEVSRAQIGDIRQEPGLRPGERVLWIQGKGRDAKDELVVLTEDTLAPIEAYLEARGKLRTRPSKPLFASESDRNYGDALSTRSISRIVKRALRRVGLDDARLTAHSMRHTAITLAILGGATPQQAQAMARHADIKVTLAYFHNLNRVEAAAERAISF